MKRHVVAHVCKAVDDARCVRSTSSLIVLGLLWLIGSGCAMKTVRTQVQLPPRSQQLHDSERIAVKPFEGTYGDRATRRLKEAITTTDLHKVATMDRSTIRRMQKKKLARKGTKGVTVEGKTGPTVVLQGEVIGPKYSRNVEKDEREECVSTNSEGECTKQATVTRYTLEETCTVQVRGNATGVKKGRVFFDETTRGKTSTSRSKDGEVPSSRKDKLCRKAFDKSIDKLVRWVAPVKRRVAVQFHKIGPSEADDRAMEHVEAGNLKRARSKFEGVVQASNLSQEDRGWARYNLAVLHYMRGAFDKCTEQANMALEHLPGEDDIIGIKRKCNSYIQ